MTRRPVDPFAMLERVAHRLASIEERLGESRVVRVEACAWCGIEDCAAHCRFCLVGMPEEGDPRSVDHAPACPYTTGVFVADTTYFCGSCGDPILEGERFGWLGSSAVTFDEEGNEVISSYSMPGCLDCQASEIVPPADA